MPRTAAPLAPAVRSDVEVESLIRGSREMVGYTVNLMIKTNGFASYNDDFRSVALIAMWKAARVWDPGVGISWRSYVIMRMKQAILDEIRTMTHRGRQPLPVYTADLNGRSADGDSYEIEIPSEHPGPEADLDREENAVELVTAMAKLDDQQLDVLTRYFFEDENMETIGAALGVSESRVSQIVRLGKQNLRVHITSARRDN